MYVQPYFDNYNCHFCCSGDSAAPPEKAKTIKIGGANPPEKGNMLKIGGANPPETDKNLFSGGDAADTVFWSTRSDISPF